MQASPWRVIRHEAANGALNIAVDEAIAQMVGHEIGRASCRERV